MALSMQMHHIQRDILMRLSDRSPQRFSELQPKNIANNTFTYHLKRLMDLGYIEQGSDGYSATRKALKAVTYQANSEIVRSSPPLLLTMLYITDGHGRIMLMKNKGQPFAGWYGLPSGMIHHSEKIEDAARRELYEKTAIRSSKNLSFGGVLDFRYNHRTTNDTFVHAIAFVYKYQYKSDKPETEAKLQADELKWSSFDQDTILPEVNAVKLLIESNMQDVVSLNFMEPADLVVKNS